jgi:hypothetical protein
MQCFWLSSYEFEILDSFSKSNSCLLFFQSYQSYQSKKFVDDL